LHVNDVKHLRSCELLFKLGNEELQESTCNSIIVFEFGSLAQHRKSL